MTRLRADNIEKGLKERARNFCQLAETCAYISRAECTKCIQYYITYFPRR